MSFLAAGCIYIYLPRLDNVIYHFYVSLNATGINRESTHTSIYNEIISLDLHRITVIDWSGKSDLASAVKGRLSLTLPIQSNATKPVRRR